MYTKSICHPLYLQLHSLFEIDSPRTKQSWQQTGILFIFPTFQESKSKHLKHCSPDQQSPFRAENRRVVWFYITGIIYTNYKLRFHIWSSNGNRRHLLLWRKPLKCVSFYIIGQVEKINGLFLKKNYIKR